MRLPDRQHRHRRVVAGDPGHPAAPPRTRPADEHVGVRRLHAPRPHLGLVLGERPQQVAVEDVPAREAELGLELDRRARLQARLAGRARSTGSPRSARPARCSATPASTRSPAPWPAGSPREQPRRHVQPEAGQRLRARLAQLGAEDRGIGERVAVDLARRQLGHPPALGLAVGERELGGGLVDVKRPRERLVRDPPTGRAAAAAAVSSMLTLSCAPSGGGSGPARPAAAPARRARRWQSTWRACTDPPSKRTSAATPSVSIEVTSTPSWISAPAPYAIPASGSVSAPIPPTGTSQSPVPLPITW